MADKSIGRILIVDDVPLNRELLALRLGGAGYATFQAEDGHGCLSRVAEGGIDMVILDVMMPDMSGIEVLKILREGHSMTDLPVIMATARTESDHVVEALNLGANDYVTKPIDFPILFARMRTHMALKRLSQQKDEFLQIASHDLKNPLCVVLSAVRMVEDLCPPGTVMCQDFHRLMAGAGRQALAMKGIIENYLDIQAAEDGQLSLERSPTDLAELLRQAVESQRSYAHSKSIVLVADAEPCTTDVDRLRLRQVLDNLLGNAIKFSDPGTTAVARLRR